MLSINNLTYRIQGRLIFDGANASVMDGWKIGVVGLNGTGKTTLFKLILKELENDGGEINISAKHRIGVVRQDMPECDTPLIDLVLQADEERTALLAASETEHDPEKLSDIIERLNTIDAYTAPARAAIILAGLGFKEDQITAPFSSLSGGWRMRVALAGVLFLQPEVLLLDEPTNHLDLEAIIWLEQYLMNYPHTLLIISHDRELLNKCADHIIHVYDKKLTTYTGNYDSFERERAEKLGNQQKLHEKQQAQRAHMQAFIDRFRAKASKARQAQSRIKMLEKMDLVDAVIADRAVRFSFPEAQELPPPMISIDHADIGYAPGKPILRQVHDTINSGDRIALLGANGNGKSTMMKLLAGKLTPLAGEVHKSSKLKIGYFSQHQTEELDLKSTPYREMASLYHKHKGEAKEPVVRAKLGSFGFSKDLADNEIGKLSGGEKARLLFALMSFDAPHMLLLDEPTNHLDIDAREALVQALNDYDGAVVIVSHDPSMVERVADRLWVVRDGAVKDFEGDLSDYRRFLIDAKRNERRGEKAGKNERKEQRKRDADLRQALAPLSEAVAAAEKAVQKATAEKSRLETLMADPDFYENADEAKEVQYQHGRIVKELAQQEAAWLRAQETYEQAKTAQNAA